MGAVDLPEPRIGPASKLAPKPVKFVLNWGRRYSLWVFNFGLACCAIEFIATSMSRHDFIRLGVIPFAPGPRQADLMVVSGTVSDKMAPAVKRLYEQMPEPKYVISFGACSNCGGPYWDSYCVTKGVDQIIPVDVYVPGCPPRPEALLHGIIRLQEKIATESLGGRYAEPGESVAPPPEVKAKAPTPAVFRRPLVLPPVPEPEEIEAAEESTQSLALPEAEAVADVVRARDLSPAQQEQVEAAEETVEVPVPQEPVAEETQQLPPAEEPEGESASAETQQIAPLPDTAERGAEETQVLPPADEVQRLAEEAEAAEEPVSERTAGTNQLPHADEVRREASAFEDTQEYVPGQEATLQDAIPKEATEATRRDLPSAEEVRKAAEERQPPRRRGARLRKFAEPPPVDALDDPDIIPGLRDDD
ncbi:NADH-quinone oxidoreductase subunit NuoB [Actinomadura sp. DC4]|uniref:NADH-quinone oxidoreductase subunit B n=1 Tax=Actinomadura sp. DC4 TaxID=3055069 RepID=UPI0025B0A72E|nr:NADH-quinone oxidoreductase subunit NuoB [Actinomadura sp. DC4]MDN3355996.1 NADH-quinone oxidoreductase subunit NuoB [Actinomadura sp. DC4]